MENQTQTETIAQKAYRLLEAVPADKWIIGRFTDWADCCCALGHYNRLISRNPENYSGTNCAGLGSSRINYKARQYFNRMEGYVGIGIPNINDSADIPPYTEPTPKERVLHLLTDMIEAGY